MRLRFQGLGRYSGNNRRRMPRKAKKEFKKLIAYLLEVPVRSLVAGFNHELGMFYVDRDVPRCEGSDGDAEG